MQDMCFQEANKCLEDPEHRTFLKMPEPPIHPSKPHIQGHLNRQQTTASKASLASSKIPLGQPSNTSLMKGMVKDSCGEDGQDDLVKAMSSFASNEQGAASPVVGGSDSQASGALPPGVKQSRQVLTIRIVAYLSQVVCNSDIVRELLKSM